MIEKVQHAISMDETRYYLNGVFLATIEKDGKKFIRMVATDGHRLAMADEELPEESKFDLPDGCIIPKKGVNELKKALSEVEGDASVCFKDRNIIVRCDNLLFIIRLIDEDFPQYNQVIPSGNDKVVKCSRDELQNSLRSVSLLSTETGKGVKLELMKNAVIISASNPELGEAKDELTVEYDDDEMEIGFNARYFLDILAVVPHEDVVLMLADKLSPGLIQVPDDPGFTAVIMPMRM